MLEPRLCTVSQPRLTHVACSIRVWQAAKASAFSSAEEKVIALIMLERGVRAKASGYPPHDYISRFRVDRVVVWAMKELSEAEQEGREGPDVQAVAEQIRSAYFQEHKDECADFSRFVLDTSVTHLNHRCAHLIMRRRTRQQERCPTIKNTTLFLGQYLCKAHLKMYQRTAARTPGGGPVVLGEHSALFRTLCHRPGLRHHDMHCLSFGYAFSSVVGLTLGGAVRLFGCLGDYTDAPQTLGPGLMTSSMDTIK